MQDRARVILWFYGHFVHDGVNIYRKGFRRKRKRGANAAAAIRRTTANPLCKKANQATNGQVTADAERRVTAFIQRRIDKLSYVLKIHQYKNI
jgi:hypothetical protein